MPKRFAELITEWKKPRTDVDVAPIFDVTPSTVGRWCSGESLPQPQRYERVAGALGMPVSQLAEMLERERAATGNTKYNRNNAVRTEILSLIANLAERITALESRLPPDDPPSPPDGRRRPPKP